VKNKTGKFVWSEIVAKNGQPCTAEQKDPKNILSCVKNEAGKFVWGEMTQRPPTPSSSPSKQPPTSDTSTAGDK